MDRLRRPTLLHRNQMWRLLVHDLGVDVVRLLRMSVLHVNLHVMLLGRMGLGCRGPLDRLLQRRRGRLGGDGAVVEVEHDSVVRRRTRVLSDAVHPDRLVIDLNGHLPDLLAVLFEHMLHVVGNIIGRRIPLLLRGRRRRSLLRGRRRRVILLLLIMHLLLLGWHHSLLLLPLLGVLLLVLSWVLAVGMSWSHIRRKLTGQYDTDEIEG